MYDKYTNIYACFYIVFFGMGVQALIFGWYYTAFVCFLGSVGWVVAIDWTLNTELEIDIQEHREAMRRQNHAVQ